MQTDRRTAPQYWVTPILSVLIGLVYLIAFSLGGHPREGVIPLGVMAVFSAGVALAGRHSGTVRGLLDHRDARIDGIDLGRTGTAPTKGGSGSGVQVPSQPRGFPRVGPRSMLWSRCDDGKLTVRQWSVMKRAALALVAGVALAGCSPTVSATSPKVSSTTPTAPITAYEQQHPRWQPCGSRPGSRLECGTIMVPLDYQHPTERTIELAVSRLPATDAAHHKGILLLNTGGPGDPGLHLPEYQHAPKKVTDAYDLIGFDPRFVGHSTPLSCGLTADEASWPRWPGKDGFTGEVTLARGVAEKCAVSAGDVLPHITTANTARDMEIVRGVLGAPTLSYVGYSYGTYLGAVYLRLFPQHVDQIVLDSVVNPDQIGWALWRGWGPGWQGSYDHFTRWAADYDRMYHLGTTPDAVRARVDALLARLDRTLAPKPDGGTLRGNDVREKMMIFLYSQRNYPLLAAGLQLLDQAKPVQPSPRPDPAVPADNSTVVFLTELCQEGQWSHQVVQYAAAFAADSIQYPYAGPMAGDITPCAFWRTRPAEPPVSLVGMRKSALLVQSTRDPSTPPPGAEAMRHYLPSSVIASIDATVHAVYAQFGDTCVDDTVADYLLSGRLPTGDVNCGRAPEPVPPPTR